MCVCENSRFRRAAAAAAAARGIIFRKVGIAGWGYTSGQCGLTSSQVSFHLHSSAGRQRSAASRTMRKVSVELQRPFYVGKLHRETRWGHQRSTFMYAQAWLGVRGHWHTCLAPLALCFQEITPPLVSIRGVALEKALIAKLIYGFCCDGRTWGAVTCV